MTTSSRILVLRFSSLGDIAMTVPVIRQAAEQNSHTAFIVVSAARVESLFENIPNVNFLSVDLNKYRGLTGLWRLSKRIKREAAFDAVADLHDSLRTRIIRFFLRAPKVAVIRKGRKEKKELTRKVNKVFRPLRSMFERYADVFRSLGLAVDLGTQKKRRGPVNEHRDVKVIGVAPFAKHASKMYPADQMSSVINLLAAMPENKIAIFGSPDETFAYAEGFARANINACSAKNLREELSFMKTLDLMISMDSANMHLASLAGIPVISLWGGTHPYAGFAGWNNREENILQVELPCRPSSVFGDKPCPVHGAAGCMQQLLPETVVARSLAVLNGE